jgi:hypothetical protein
MLTASGQRGTPIATRTKPFFVQVSCFNDVAGGRAETANLSVSNSCQAATGSWTRPRQ